MGEDTLLVLLLVIILFQFIWLLKMLRASQKDWEYFQSKMEEIKVAVKEVEEAYRWLLHNRN